MTKKVSRPSRKNLRYWWHPWAALVVSLYLTAYSSFVVYQNGQLAAGSRFAVVAGEIRTKIAERIHAYEQVLRGGLGLFSASELVTRDEWRRYVQQLDLQKGFPGIQGVGFAVHLAPDERADHIRQVRQDGFPEYHVWPEGNRDEYSAIVFLEPFTGRNLRAFGYDMLSEPIRRAAMHAARDSGAIAASGKVTLVQETDEDVQPGFLIYLPLYRQDQAATTPEQRRRALLGWVYAPFRMRDLLTGILGSEQDNVHLRIYDGDKAAADNLLFDSQPRAVPDGGSPLAAIHRIDVGSHIWTLQLRAQRVFLGSAFDYSKVLMVAVGGSVTSLLLFAIANSLVTTNVRARAMAERLTASLRKSREFHHRLVTLADEGIIAMDVAAEVNYVNPKMAEMLGYDAADMLGKSFLQFIDPSDHEPVRQGLESRRRGISETYEIGMVRKGGGWLFTRLSAVPLTDDAGVFQGSFAMVSDITARKRAEQVLLDSEFRFRNLAQSAKDAIVSIDAEGRVVSWNQAATRIFGYSEDEMLGRSVTAIMPRRFAEHHPEYLQRYLDTGIRHVVGKTLEMQGLRRSGEEFPLELSLSEWEFNGHPFFTAIMRDIAERKQAEARILRLSGLYKALGRINEAIIRATHRDELFRQACEIAVEAAGFKMAWIGLIDQETHRVEPVASHGAAETYIARIRVSADPLLPEGQGPVGKAIQEGKPQVCNDFQEASAALPWHEAAVEAGFFASAAFALKLQGKSVGAMSLYSGQPHFFDEEYVDLLGRMAENLSFALDNFRHEADRRRAEMALRESEERYWGIFDAEQDPIFLFEQESGVLIDANQAAVRLYGYPIEELKRLGVCHLAVNCDDIRTHDVERRGVPVSVMYHRKKSGERFPVEVTRSHFVLGCRLVTIAAVRDITERMQAETALRDSEERLRRAVTEAPIPIMIHAQGGEVMLLSHAWEELSGYTLADIPDTEAWIVKAYGDTPGALETIGLQINAIFEREETRADGEYTVRARDGRALIWDFRSSLLGAMPDGRRLAITMAMDVTDRRAIEEKVRHLAHYDALTDLPNRFLLQDRIERALALAKRSHGVFALIYFDLDHFKAVNDSLGHDVGDALLVATAQRLKVCVRDSDTVGRFGGDEFLALLPEIGGATQAAIVAEKIRKAMAESFRVSGHELNISSSIGIALFPRDGEDFQALLKAADVAMYRAKNLGRNRFCFSSPLSSEPQGRERPAEI